MTCGGFRVRYQDDERLFDTHAPIVALLLLLAFLCTMPLFATMS
jgi:hypothetical protein